MRNTIQQLLNGIFIGSIYALFGLGYTLVFGLLDVLNLAHSEVFMLGAVVTYSLVALHHVPFLLAVPLGIVAGGLLGLVIEFVALRPLRRRGAPPIAALISTIGLALILVALIEQAKRGSALAWLWRDGANDVQFPAGKVPDRIWHLAGLTLPVDKLAIVVITVALMAVLAYVMAKTPAGRAVRAVAENPRAAQLLGVNVDRVITITLVVSSALAALAGILFALALNDISPYIGRDQVELRGLAVIVLGGMGSIPGTFIGGFTLGLLESVTILTLGTDVRAVGFVALFVMLILRPSGLLGRQTSERV
ncbi:MAG: branched-chain amino acid transport system permease protein [Acidimicrobiaceae bacterium]|nr:branched-chain amino acid transport system permease protein [Acidimicrobiaceae bacterium]MDQ1364065.1 branched-chain amino acid transport system permease protein [Acidimicrobiaceae bacterium]MDQ1369914.1 branched-chain amino acid transport system permease protein [Acidimicrobiaceae bacterium]MDQ1377922.1 branched-chain amino acid transport system permease protein [Acidimicrobiaceae bacterium]MDQ1401391.1 branched-chain amino acid transport system permease protein [Acidimicrobiaceae bacterium